MNVRAVARLNRLRTRQDVKTLTGRRSTETQCHRLSNGCRRAPQSLGYKACTKRSAGSVASDDEQIRKNAEVQDILGWECLMEG